MRYCLFGGTFDPPHWGHLLLAETVYSQFSLEKFVFIPANIPPHKQNEELSTPQHRIEMLKIICDNNSHFSLDTREIDRAGISYTIETVRDIKSELNLATKDIGFLIGSDNYSELDSWREADNLIAECQIFVASRPDYPAESTSGFADEVHFLNLPRVEISSSLIRQRLRNGQSIRYYVLPIIQEYIYQHGLYNLKDTQISF